jgi:hypothetical protein
LAAPCPGRSDGSGFAAVLVVTAPLAAADTTIEVNDTGMAVDPSDHKCTLIEAIIAANTDTVS